MRPLEASTSLQVASRPSTYNTYRGSLVLVLGSRSVSVVNHVELDQYLRGVVPAEMPTSWPREALRAQVIAARSYAVRELNPGTGTYDMVDDTRSQIYRGIKGERSVTDALIAAEPGAVIRAGGTIVKAFFFSTGGGATENNEYVFVSSKGTPGTSQRGVPARHHGPLAGRRPVRRSRPRSTTGPRRSLSRTTLSAMFAKDAAHERRQPDEAGPPPARRVRAAVPGGAVRLGGDEDGLRRHVPLRLQRDEAVVREDAALEPVRHEAHPAAVALARSRARPLAVGAAQSSRRRNSAMPASSTSTTQATAHAVNASGGGASAKNGFARIASALRAADISSTTGGSRP